MSNASEPITDEQTRIEVALWEAIYPDPDQRPAEALRPALLAPVMAVVAPLVTRAEDAERRIQAVIDYWQSEADRRAAVGTPYLTIERFVSDLRRALDGEGNQR